MIPLKQLLLILAALGLAGCGGSKEKEEKTAKAKAVAEAKKESAKVIEATIRLHAKKPTGELTKAQIAELRKALLKCDILSNPTKQSFILCETPSRLARFSKQATSTCRPIHLTCLAPFFCLKINL